MPTSLPTLHTQLGLRDADDRVWPSRVEAIDPYALTVARPFDLPLEDSPAVGTTILVTWAADGGSFSVPAELVEIVRDGRVVLWVMAPRGEITRAQRREHFRLPHDAMILINVERRPITGHLLDVSEAAARCRIAPADGEHLDPGTELSIAFAIGQDRFDLEGRVLRQWPSERSNGKPAADLVVVFDLSEPQARDLRKVLLAEQVRRRRLGQE